VVKIALAKSGNSTDHCTTVEKTAIGAKMYIGQIPQQLQILFADI